MANYGYVAISPAGKEVKGSVEADNAELAKAQVKKEGLIVLSLSEQNLLTRDISFQIGGKPSDRDMAVFCRQFSSMSKAGVPVIQVLKLLEEQTENKKLAKAIRELRVNVEKGESVAQSMQEQEDIFPGLLINTVAAGEASGSLEKAFDRMATQFEKGARTTAMVKKAMIYPSVVALVAVGVVIVMLVVVVPAYTSMFDQLGTKLPPLTVAVVNMSNFIKNRWYILFPAIIAIVALVRWYKNTTAGQYTLGRLALKSRIFGNLRKKQACSLLARTLSTMISSGVPLTEALEITSKTMPNVIYRDAMRDAREEVIAGGALSTAIERSSLFPPMVYNMIRIGEEAGSTEEMLEKLADYYDEEVEQAVQAMMAAMEPMIILIMAGIVGILIAAVMGPILTLYSSLDNM